MLDEPLLQDTDNRFTSLPVKHHDIRRQYEIHLASFWLPKEVKLHQDLVDWPKLSDGVRHFIKHVLAFFAASDGIVMENLAVRFLAEVQCKELRSYYSFQIAMESIHNDMYGMLIMTLIKDAREQAHLFNAITQIPAVAKKAAWACKWISSTASFATRMVAFAAVEGIQFSGSFCAIFFLREMGVMPGLCASNDFISRDEGNHTDTAAIVYVGYIANKLTDAEIHEMFREAVAIEKEFIIESLPCTLIGMNAGLMSQYIEYVADRLLKQLGHPPIYGSTNPFPFMERICLQTQTNFFEHMPTEYARDGGAHNESDDF